MFSVSESREKAKARNERSSQFSDFDDKNNLSASPVLVEAIAVDQYIKSSNASSTVLETLPSSTLKVSEGNRSRKWPKSLQQAVVSSFKRKPDEEHTRKFLNSYHWPSGLIESFLLTVEKVPIRFFIIDDSGSMNTNDGLKLIGKEGGKDNKIIGCTRWSELSDTVIFHANLAEASKCPTEFRMLNGADPVMVGLGDDNGDGLSFLTNVMDDSPAGQTPLCEHIEDVVNAISSIESDLRAGGQRAIVVIATDGEASDGNVTAALKPLEKLPVILILRLCTNDEKLVKYWNEVDKQLEVEVDVLDDICGDGLQVVKVNPWLTYSDSLHKMREFGAALKEFDLVDEAELTSEQMRLLVALLLFDGKKRSVPHPDEDWNKFSTAVTKKMKEQKRLAFDISTRQLKPIIDMKLLKEIYHDRTAPGRRVAASGGNDSAVCTIS